MNECDRNLLGITASNAWGNLFSYSLLAAHSLDFSASAAGRIDTEAARMLRMAQNMIRTRLDILVKQSVYVTKEVERETLRLKVGTEPLKEFARLQVACSEDSASLQKMEPEDKKAEFENGLLAINGERAKIEGALIFNLVEIIKAELAFYHMPLESAVKPISNDQRDLMNSLKMGAVVISDIVHQAIEKLKGKLAHEHDLYVCTNCGTLYYELPEEEKCGICDAGLSLIVKYPFPIRGNIEEMERYLYERYNPAPKAK